MLLSDLFSIQKGDAAIVLETGLCDKQLARTFVPTQSSVQALKHLIHAVRPDGTLDDRAINLFGIYGAGKSRLAVLIGQILRDGIGGQELDSLQQRLIQIGESQLANSLRAAFLPKDDEDARPYLIVPMYGNIGTSLQGAMVEALYKALEDSHTINPATILNRTEYSVALSRLNEILDIDGGRSFSDEYLPSLGLGPQYLNLAQLAEGLKNHEPSSLSTFSTWHQCKTFSPFHAKQHGAGHVEEIFLEASSHLADYNLRGIAIIWDEFGFALEELLTNQHRQPQREIFELQRFIEKACKPPISHVLFIGLTHVSLGEYGPRSRAAEDLKQRLKTIQGRFTSLPVELKPAEEEGYHLLSALISPTELGLHVRADNHYRAQEVASICRTTSVFAHLGDSLLRITEECYPLHPLAAAGLLALSSRYAAANRTAFNYFQYAAAKGMLQRAISEQLYRDELIRLPDLIDYYLAEISQSGRSQQIQAYESAHAQVTNSGDPYVIEERRQVLAVVMLASLLDNNFQASDSFLAVALHDTELSGLSAEPLRAALSWLSEAGLIWKNDTTGYWKIGGDGTTDIEHLIEDATNRIQELSFVEYVIRYKEIASGLLPMLGEHVLDPSPTGIVRRYSVVLTDSIPNSPPNLTSRLGALVKLVFPVSPEQALEFEQNIASYPEANIYYWISFSENKSYASNFRRLLGLSNLLEQALSEGIKTQLLAKHESTRQLLIHDLSAQYGRVGLKRGNCKVRRQGVFNKIEVSSWADFISTLQINVDKCYPSEISVRASQKKRNILLNDESLVSAADTLGIVDHILSFANHPAYQNDLLGYSEDSEPGAIVDGILGANGLFKKTASGWILTPTTDLTGSIREVVDLARSEILQRRARPYLLTELTKKLCAPPYGIPSGAIPIIVSYAIQPDVSRLVWVGTAAAANNVPKNLCASIINDRISVRVTDFTQYQLNVAEVIDGALIKYYQDLGQPISILPGTKHDKARAVVDRLKEFILEISPATFSSPKLDVRLRTICIAAQAIGKTQHDLLDVVGACIDKEKVLVGANPDFNNKIIVRDMLLDVLQSVQAVESEVIFAAVSRAQEVFPFLNDLHSDTLIASQFVSKGNVGEMIASVVSNAPTGVSSNKLYENVLSALVGKPLTEATQLDLGIAIGEIKQSVSLPHLSSPMDLGGLSAENLEMLSNAILKEANQLGIPQMQIRRYLQAVVAKLDNYSAE